MFKPCYDKMCREVLKCKNYIEWEHREEVWDHSRHYNMEMICVSCTEVGQSENILEYPKNCPHKKSLDLYRDGQIEAHRLFLIQCEKEDMWKKLNEVEA